MIVETDRGFEVRSEATGRRLSRPYATRAEAERRLRQIEYFKRHNLRRTDMARRTCRTCGRRHG